ncbi:MAG: MFS transporter [Vulcanococcus sp.]|uniref:MFS transporter n=1 Tax=Vulcanococcus sp. TaxID=2856995 RepID=UPI0025E00E7E|nr:MFS transporter [Vulcanococcus sp.]MBW0168574.1 MFS transporter [Vulcanococcus sp.]
MPRRALGRIRRQLTQHQRTTFLLASGLSTAGSFAGLTAKGWLLMEGSGNPFLLAANFALLTLPTLLVSGPAGVLTDRLGSERVLIRAQWALLAAAVLGAIAIPISSGGQQDALLLLSTLGVGVASTYELTARNKYVALLVDEPEQLGPYLASFSVIFNVGKLVGPPIGGLLLAATGPTLALSLDAATYLLPILTLLWLMAPHRERERRSAGGSGASLATAWRDCGPALRHVLLFCGLACLVGFFHPGLAPLMALELLGPSPLALGLFTSVIACGSISAGVVLQRNAKLWSRRPGLLLGGSTLITALGQLGLSLPAPQQWGLAMAFLIGGGTASLLAGTNLIIQVHAPQVIRGRMAGLGQIAFLGGGGISGLAAAGLTAWLPGGLWSCFALLGSLGAVLGVVELLRQGRTRLA